ncbi:VOC family protein [Thalassoglobus sp. JC818]|uniref:VOC family protein n=1 Tax=Thalassoglobus sp. JC818 TaxID=3232136 RepID=UPI003458AD36
MAEEKPLSPFHLAFPVRNLAESRKFYGEVLGLPEGRSDATWIDFDLFGHQIVAHERPHLNTKTGDERNSQVDGKAVPVPHFGVVLEMDQWKELAERLSAKGIEFIIEPYVRFEGQVGEQATMFFLDPSGNALEFKAFQDRSMLFAKD